jgi:hypothetical protein
MPLPGFSMNNIFKNKNMQYLRCSIINLKRISLIILFSGLFASGALAQVAINDDGSEPNGNAILHIDVAAKDKGIIIPRLTEAQRNAMSLGADDEGLTVYDTGTKSYWLWDGIQWGNFNTAPERRVGEVYEGGFIFWVDASGKHGLMASLEDLDGGSGVTWSNVGSSSAGSGAQSMTDGTSNTDAIVTQSGHSNSAARLCADYNGGGHTDWYLPSARELVMLFSCDAILNDLLENDGDPATNGLKTQFVSPFFSRYWSSTEYDNDEALHFLGINSYVQRFSKSGVCGVRAVRKF